MGPATITVIDQSVDVVEAHRYVDTQQKTGNVVLIFDAGRRGRPEKEETCRARSRSRPCAYELTPLKGEPRGPAGLPRQDRSA